nr:reverse transcriptase domain-containing protein [Tanacetum cinerariifolium]
MSTRSSVINLFPPLDNPELTIRRRSRVYPTLLNDFEMAAEGNSDLPVLDLQTMKELCQPSLNERDTFYNGLTLRHRDTINAAAGRTFMKMRPKECYDLIENMTAHHNDWDTLAQRSESSSYITSSFDMEIAALKAGMAKINKNFMRPPLAKPRTYMLWVPTNVILINLKANDAILKNMQTNMTSLTNSNLELKNMFGQFMKINTASSSGSRTLPGNTITNSKEELKGITTHSGTAYQGPMIPTTSSFLPPVVEHETKVTKDTVHPTNNVSPKYIQPSVVQTEAPILNPELVVAPIIEPVVAPVSAPKPNQKPLILDVPNDAIKLILFPYSLEGAARIWYEKETPNSILTWDDLINKFVNQFFPPSKTTHLKSEISRFTQRFEKTFGEAWERFKEMLRACPHHGFSKLTQINTFYNGLNEQDQYSLNAAAGGNLLSKITREALKIIENKSKVCYSRSKLNVSRIAINLVFVRQQINVLRGDFNKQEKNLRRNLNNDMRSILGSFFQNQDSNSGTILSNIVPNPKGEMKAVTTRSGLSYEGPSILTNSPLEKVVERETEETTDKEQSNYQGSTAHIQPPVVPISIPEPDKLPEKIGDPEKFLIPCDFPGIDVCHALADLGASINLMPLSIWKKLSLPELTPTRMTLEFTDRSITHPKGVTEDVFIKVKKFHFPTDFVVVDFEADPRVPLMLGRSFLRTGRALIDVYGEQITLRVNDKFQSYSSFYPSFSEETMSEFCKEPIVKSSSPTFTPFGESDFFLEEIEDFLKDESVLTGIKDYFYDPDGNILYLEKLLNDNPSQLPPMDLKQAEEIKEKSSIEEPSELE